MSDETCDTCAYLSVQPHEPPCRTCAAYLPALEKSNWEPRRQYGDAVITAALVVIALGYGVFLYFDAQARTVRRNVRQEEARASETYQTREGLMPVEDYVHAVSFGGKGMREGGTD